MSEPLPRSSRTPAGPAAPASVRRSGHTFVRAALCTAVLAAALPLAPVASAAPAPEPDTPVVEIEVPEHTSPVAETGSPVPPVPPVPESGGPAGDPTGPPGATGGAVPDPAPGPPAAGAPASPVEAPASPVAALLTRLRALYQAAEEATETYNAAEEALRRQTIETRRLGGDLGRTRDALTRARDEAGRLARAQYQGRLGFSPALQLLLARDPDHALDQNHLVRKAAREQALTVARLERGERRADLLATAAGRALTRERQLAARQRQARDTVRARLKAVEVVLAGLSPGQAGELADLERAETAGAQRDLLAGGELDGSRTPSRQGDRAVAYAVDQLGKPYVWGAEGPESYDCSGLTSGAWAAAGRPIPRTSQEQWRTLPKVPLRALRPGDLVVYFPRATHVALYLGEGLVIQAPRPGGRVKVSPLAANPLLGAVRPDPAAAPLAAYTPPELPAGAADGSDQGYDRGRG
ncbi:NlpC/P60 family protein [Streptomyces sp. LP05-1]|uniref:NlpC/P60 family protein n=1 Tax=Streptomyces pyxinae TaxID=2970734 RepID=A0ABT2CA68_9ACTN|nr:C40 family peptidase [Streptomyces sp. LP05-1]MCS0634285.1 NlpC/P60 family protein [Streptomyces sp. LP05-1]